MILAERKVDEIVIGTHCAIAHNVHSSTSLHKKRKYYKNEIYSEAMGQDIRIGLYVWIGANVYINGGTTIGDNMILSQ